MDDLRLHDAVIFLVAAGLVIPVAKRFRISPIVGFLLVGLAVGPFGLSRLADEWPALRWILITDLQGVGALAELGVVFLLFMIGLELSLERLWSLRRWVFGLGGAQILITGLLIGMIAAWFGNTLAASIVLGACLALSSTAIVTQLLIEQGNFSTKGGRAAFAVLLAQDIAVVPVLFLVGVLGTTTEHSVLFGLLRALAEAAIAVALIVGAGRVIVRPLLRFVGRHGTPDLFMAVTLLLIAVTATLTHYAGLSAALGAFLAGLLLAETEYRHEIEVQIEPFKGLLLGLFFMSVSMSIDLTAALENAGWVALSVIGLYVLKGAVVYALTRAFGLSRGQSLENGVLLGQGGEFAFVIVGLALEFALLPAADAQFMLIVVSATMFITPVLAKLANRASVHLDRDAPTPSDIDIASDLAGHVIIVGYGRTGQILAALLNQRQIPHVALDLDADRVATLRARGEPVYFGDASRADMLQRMRLASAAALSVCTDDARSTEATIQAARRLSRDIPIVARVHDVEHGLRLKDLGATRVVPEVCESALQLGALMLEEVGFPPSATREVIEVQRSELMLALSDLESHSRVS